MSTCDMNNSLLLCPSQCISICDGKLRSGSSSFNLKQLKFVRRPEIKKKRICSHNQKTIKRSAGGLMNSLPRLWHASGLDGTSVDGCETGAGTLIL